MIKHRKKLVILALIIALVFVIIIRLTRYEFTSIEEIKLGTILLYEGVTLIISFIVILSMTSKLRVYQGWNKLFIIIISCIMIVGLHLQTGGILFSNINITEEATEDFVFSIIRLSNFIGSIFFYGGLVLLNILFPNTKEES